MYEDHAAPAKGTGPRSRAECNALPATSRGFDAIDEKTLRDLTKVGTHVKEGLPA